MTNVVKILKHFQYGDFRIYAVIISYYADFELEIRLYYKASRLFLSGPNLVEITSNFGDYDTRFFDQSTYPGFIHSYPSENGWILKHNRKCVFIPKKIVPLVREFLKIFQDSFFSVDPDLY